MARSAIIVSPVISLPKATESLLFSTCVLYWAVSTISLNETVALFLFGISIPTADLLGIGASILTPEAARARAISSERPVILLILTPGAG